ncbi:MAG: hypothetical protein WCT99_03525 [Bacteroidota bacterium]|jgi:hypothetical protein
MTIVFSLAAAAIGGLIGWGFGTIQNNAYRRNSALQKNGNLNSGWSVMPGSMRRVAVLIMGLVVLQIIFPILFSDTTTQWLVSAGIIIGYGMSFVQRLRFHREFHS